MPKPETSSRPGACKSLEVCDEKIQTSSFPKPRKSEVCDARFQTSIYPVDSHVDMEQQEQSIFGPTTIPETTGSPGAFKSEVCDKELETRSSYPGAHNSMEVHDEEPKSSSYPQDNPPENAQVEQEQSMSVPKQRRRRICKLDNCLYCTVPPCGVCSPCINPARKNRCLYRLVTLFTFAYIFVHQNPLEN